ncbi:hypothetical protein LOK74_14990 [Brevibacillus humidisoli]|uniref:hypothetical protein n=1 Tax=Brevibacillus humidisoli TaxID=2895522 RepID=UPI001E5289FE|nr:hypothetical protein [Brevibacillus humidisoli]UFJ39373.1 hypothetical protein LOK74_14990 [Brevibacillus humidisoli]
MRQLWLVLLVVGLLAAGCTGQEAEQTTGGAEAGKVEQLEAARKQLEAERDQLKQQVAELTTQVKRLTEEKEVRNLVDLQARQVIAAMLKKNDSALRELVADTVTVEKEKLVFRDLAGSKEPIDYPFLERANDVRQRWYELQPDDRFVTGMEIYGDDSLLAVMVMTFRKEGDSWKLESIANDI